MKEEIPFNPKLLSCSDQINIANTWAEVMSDTVISQNGCAVCGCLTPTNNLYRLNLTEKMAKLLTNPTAVPNQWVSPAQTKFHWTLNDYHSIWKTYDHETISDIESNYD